MIKEETFLKLIESLKQIQKQEIDFEKAMETAFGHDSVVYLTWPEETATTMLCDVIVDIGESQEGAEWFVWEGIEQIDKGGTVIGEEVSDNWIYYKINSYTDYYNYITKNYNALEKSEKPEKIMNYDDVKVVKCSEFFGFDDE